MARFLQEKEPLGRFVAGTARNYELFEPLPFLSDIVGKIVVPARTVTDFASIPRAFWRILPPWDTHRLAAIIHDWLYSNQPVLNGVAVTKDIADRVFLEAMQELKVPAWKANTMYRAVKWFGGSIWDEHKRKREQEIRRLLDEAYAKQS